MRSLDLKPTEAQWLEGPDVRGAARPRDVGNRVDAGQLIATVVARKSGPPHVHIELWKSLGGGYRLENMSDPVTVLR